MRTYTTKHPRFDSMIDRFNGPKDRVLVTKATPHDFEWYELVGRSVLHLVKGQPVIIVVHDSKAAANNFMDGKRGC